MRRLAFALISILLFASAHSVSAQGFSSYSKVIKEFKEYKHLCNEVAELIGDEVVWGDLPATLEQFPVLPQEFYDNKEQSLELMFVFRWIAYNSYQTVEDCLQFRFMLMVYFVNDETFGEEAPADLKRQIGREVLVRAKDFLGKGSLTGVEPALTALRVLEPRGYYDLTTDQKEQLVLLTNRWEALQAKYSYRKKEQMGVLDKYVGDSLKVLLKDIGVSVDNYEKDLLKYLDPIIDSE